MRKASSILTLSILTCSCISAYAGLITIGGRLGYGIMKVRQNTLSIANEDDDTARSITIDQRAGSGIVGGIYGRIGEFVHHYIYLAATASYNPQDVIYQTTDNTPLSHTLKYQRTFELGGLFGIRWIPHSVIFTEVSYSNLRMKSFPDNTQTQAIQPAFTRNLNGAEIGIGVDAYVHKYLIVTIEYQHGFYQKAYPQTFTDIDGATTTMAFAPQTNTITAGLGVTFA
jgi:hypothetical protein